jgi:hypothetical protein
MCQVPNNVKLSSSSFVMLCVLYWVEMEVNLHQSDTQAINFSQKTRLLFSRPRGPTVRPLEATLEMSN